MPVDISNSEEVFLGDLGEEAAPERLTSKMPPIGPIELEGYSLDINSYLTRDYDDIAQASTELPPIIEWINYNLQSITEQKIRKDDEIKEREAIAWFNLQNGGFEDMNYAGKKTVHSLIMAIKLDPDVKKARFEYSVLAGWHQRLFNLMTSLQAKLELVRSAEATRRNVFGSQNKQ